MSMYTKTREKSPNVYFAQWPSFMMVMGVVLMQAKIWILKFSWQYWLCVLGLQHHVILEESYDTCKEFIESICGLGVRCEEDLVGWCGWQSSQYV